MNQIGIYNLLRASDAGNKALEIFRKIKRKSEQVETKTQPGTELIQQEPNLRELQESAMNSY